MPDAYSVLGLEKNTPLDEVKKAYRSLAKKYHPDKNPNNPKAVERFRQITSAYSTIVDGKYVDKDLLKQTQARSHPSPPPVVKKVVELVMTIDMSLNYRTFTKEHDGNIFRFDKGVLAGARYTIDSIEDAQYKIDIRFKERDNYLYKGNDLFTTMSVDAKKVKEGLSFHVPDHPNFERKKVTFPKDIKTGDMVRMAGHGLIGGSEFNNQLGDLYITVNLLNDRFIFANILKVFGDHPRLIIILVINLIVILLVSV